MPTPPVGGTGYYNGEPVQSTVVPGSFDLGGDKTTQITEPKSDVIVTSNNAKTQYNNDSMDLSKALSMYDTNNNMKAPGDEIDIKTYSDPYTKMLDELSSKSNASTKALISTIQAQRYSSANDINTTYGNYKKGLQLLGIQHNDAQFTPELLAGRVQEADNQRMKKIQDLDIEERKALMDAENAQAEKDFTTLKEKMAYIKDIKKEKQDELKRVLENMQAQKGIADIQAHQIYDTMQKLAPAARESFLHSVADKLKIPVTALVAAVSDEKLSREKSDLELQNARSIIANRGASGAGGYKLTATQKTSLLGTGLTTSDINTLQSQLNSGYTLDEILNQSDLTASQEKAIRTAFKSEGAPVTPYITTDWLKTKFTTKQLHKYAGDAGLTKTFVSNKKEADKFAKYVQTVVQQYRDAGESDDTIEQNLPAIFQYVVDNVDFITPSE